MSESIVVGDCEAVPVLDSELYAIVQYGMFHFDDLVGEAIEEENSLVVYPVDDHNTPVFMYSSDDYHIRKEKVFKMAFSCLLRHRRVQEKDLEE